MMAFSPKFQWPIGLVILGSCLILLFGFTSGCGSLFGSASTHSTAFLGISFGGTTTEAITTFGQPTSQEAGTGGLLTFTWSDKRVAFYPVTSTDINSAKLARIILGFTTDYSAGTIKVNDPSSKVLDAYGFPFRQRDTTIRGKSMTVWYYNSPNYIYSIDKRASDEARFVSEVGIWDNEVLQISAP